MNKKKAVLKVQGRFQAWLAEKLGYGKVMMANYCNNKSQPKVETLYDIAKFLGVEVSELLEPKEK